MSYSNLVVPGEPISVEKGYLKGHGAYVDHQSAPSSSSSNPYDGPLLIASVAGQVERVNKLISVKAAKSRFSGNMGDLIVGRITSIENKRWKVDIRGLKDAALQLSSVNLPGGAQRIRTYEDQLQMRSLFAENDLVSAEIQNIGADGLVSLHARNLKYGKLENGQLIIVPSVLVKDMPQHYVSLPWEIDVIIGKNGMIWVTRTIPIAWKEAEEERTKVSDEAVPLAETLQVLKQKHASTPLTKDERLNVARISNVIKCLACVHRCITPEAISSIFQRSLDLNMGVEDLLDSQNLQKLI